MTLASETRTAPGAQYAVEENVSPSGGTAAPTRYTVTARFEDMRGLLADRPLRRPNRTLPLDVIEDQEDLQAYRDRQNEPGIPWEQVKRELGL